MERDVSRTPTPRDWVERFEALYNASAADLQTDLGLFYDRHRRFVVAEPEPSPMRTEYTNDEWDRVMAQFLSRLSGEFGLLQVTDWTGGRDLVWHWPGASNQPVVVIRPANEASESILRHDVPAVARSGAPLAVLLMYPDYPAPQGADGIGPATKAWQARIEAELATSGPTAGFLLLTIGSNEWDLPAPWRGFAWNHVRHRLEPITDPSRTTSRRSGGAGGAGRDRDLELGRDDGASAPEPSPNG